MAITFNANIDKNYAGLESFRSKRPDRPVVQAPPVEDTKVDEVVIKEETKAPEAKETAPEEKVVYVEKKPKKSIWAKLRGAYASVKKGVVNTVEYTKGFAKGIYYGAMAAGSVLAVDAAIGTFKILKANRAAQLAEKAAQAAAEAAPQVAQTVAENAPKVAKSALKVLSTKGKVIAGLAAAGAMGVNLFKAYLNANEKKAQIDHRWQTGHDS